VDHSFQRTEDAGRCAACGGFCCQRAPGRFAPEELAGGGRLDAEAVLGRLEAGSASITTSFIAVCDRRLAPVFTVAARGCGKGRLVLCASNIRCSFLEQERCMLSLALRPFECAMMVPDEDVSKCVIPEGLSMEELWLPHQQALHAVIRHCCGRPWAEELRRQIEQAPDSDQYAQGAKQLLKALGLAESEEEIQDVVKRAWSRAES